MPMEQKSSCFQDPVQSSCQKVTYNRLFWISVIAGSLIKLWLVSAQNLSAFGGAVQDEQLYIFLANSIVQGNWLGDYNNLTLVKGPFYPLFIAFSFLAGLPLIFSQHILYILSCLVFVLAVSPVIKNRHVLVLIFLIILFNPVTFAADVMPRALRDAIYPSLVLVLWSCAAGLLLRYERSIKNLLLWSLGLGTSLSFLWLTREEGVWILPAMIMLTAVTGYAVIKSSAERRFIRLIIIIFPYLILLSSISIISAVNYRYYGVYETVDIKSKEFKAAYGALSRVETPQDHVFLPVPEHARQKIYQISPSFAELQPYLDKSIAHWSEMLCRSAKLADILPHFDKRGFENLFEVACQDIAGGWFLWAFRESVSSAGYYSSAPSARDYYRKLGREINDACAAGTLECTPPRNTLAPRPRKEIIPPFLDSLKRALKTVVYMEGIIAHPHPSTGSKENLRMFEDITRNRLNGLCAATGVIHYSGINVSDVSIAGVKGNYTNGVVYWGSRNVPNPYLPSIKEKTSNNKDVYFEARFNCLPRQYLVVEYADGSIESLPITSQYSPDHKLHGSIEISLRYDENILNNQINMNFYKISALQYLADLYSIFNKYITVISFFILCIFIVKKNFFSRKTSLQG